jgi:hypothetical protein
VSRGQRGGSPMIVNLSFLDRSLSRTRDNTIHALPRDTTWGISDETVNSGDEGGAVTSEKRAVF